MKYVCLTVTNSFAGVYVDKPFFHLNILVFIKYLVNQRFIDHMWFDAGEWWNYFIKSMFLNCFFSEGAEYGIFDMLHRNGAFDNEGIVICQINMEVDFSHFFALIFFSDPFIPTGGPG